MVKENNSNKICLTRIFNAPVKAVWDAWSRPELFAQWWVPQPEICRVVTLDLKRFEVLKAGGKIIDGSTGRELPRPEVVLLRGTANGDPGSSVFLSLSRYGHQGWVSIGGEQYILSSGPANGNKVTRTKTSQVPASAHASVTNMRSA